jgi:peptidoglycan/xylan/chitin deacetylase (PgdA/CDA1 family)
MNSKICFRLNKNIKNLKKLLLIDFLSKAHYVLPYSLRNFFLAKLRLQYEVCSKKNKTLVDICRYKNDAQSAFCISMDFDNQGNNLNKNSDLIDRSTSLLLFLSKKYDIPISWGICGITSKLQPVAFKKILESGHDIGVHSYGHYHFDDPSLTKKDILEDTKKCIKLIGPNFSPKVFIFPWNIEGHFEILEALDFIAYRGRENKLGYPKKMHHLWNIHPVCYINHNWRSSNLLMRYVDLAISFQSLFHIWSHPWSITLDGDPERYSREIIEPLFQYVDNKRKKGILWPCTLRELANYCEAIGMSHVESYKWVDGNFIIKLSCDIIDKRYDTPPIITITIRLPNIFSKILVDGNPIKSIYRDKIVLNIQFQNKQSEIRLIK